jgi:hypothetical protein
MLTSCAALMSSAVRWSMNTGLPRHITVTRCPSAILAMSTSVVDSASTSAAGFIWSMKGHRSEATPTAPTAPVAR